MTRKSPAVLILLGFAVISVLACIIAPVSASNPPGAYYSDTTNDIIWFIHTSDLHIGARGTQDTDNFDWLVTQAKEVIAPDFIIVTGDLTDSTNGNFLGYPNGPYQEEWDQYRAIANGRVTPNDYYDLPGNHEQYNDRDFSFYLANSVQAKTQVSFTKLSPAGRKYHFLGINTADNSGSAFSILPPYGDYAGLDANELSFINAELAANQDSALTMVFGHHPLAPTGNAEDTYVYYGLDEFLNLMDFYYCALYGYGHTHASSEAFFSPGLAKPGFFYLNVASLGKSSSNQYSVFAIDCNGISSTTRTAGNWPVVLITAPVDRYYGNVTSPYGYDVPASGSSPIRALAFDPDGIFQMDYRIDGSSTWYPMTNIAANPKLWSAGWNSSALAQGDHTIEVRATSTTGATSSNTITTRVLQSQPPPQLHSHIDSLTTGKYVKQRKATAFVSSDAFIQGDAVVFRARVVTDTGSVTGAAVTLSITGPETVSLTTGASDSQGIAEAKWTTKAPLKRSTGTRTGTYAATVTNVTASGYMWDGVTTTAKATFTIAAR